MTQLLLNEDVSPDGAFRIGGSGWGDDGKWRDRCRPVHLEELNMVCAILNRQGPEGWFVDSNRLDIQFNLDARGAYSCHVEFDHVASHFATHLQLRIPGLYVSSKVITPTYNKRFSYDFKSHKPSDSFLRAAKERVETRLRLNRECDTQRDQDKVRLARLLKLLHVHNVPVVYTSLETVGAKIGNGSKGDLEFKLGDNKLTMKLTLNDTQLDTVEALIVQLKNVRGAANE